MMVLWELKNPSHERVIFPLLTMSTISIFSAVSLKSALTFEPFSTRMRLTRALGICISTTKASSWGEWTSSKSQYENGRILESMASGLLMEATVLGFLQAAHLSFQVFPRYSYLPYVIHSIKHSFPLRLDMVRPRSLLDFLRCYLGLGCWGDSSEVRSITSVIRVANSLNWEIVSFRSLTCAFMSTSLVDFVTNGLCRTLFRDRQISMTSFHILSIAMTPSYS